MSSTGEVGCIGDNYYEAILKSMLSVGYDIPEKTVLISSGPMRSKVELINSCNALIGKGYKIYSTPGTHDFLKKNNIDSNICYWPDDASNKPNALELIENKEIDLVVNIPKDLSKGELDNDYLIRRNAIDYNIPLITNSRLASAFILAFFNISKDEISIKSWKEYK